MLMIPMCIKIMLILRMLINRSTCKTSQAIDTFLIKRSDRHTYLTLQLILLRRC